MSTYFAGYPGFIADPNAELLVEFARLATARNWKEGSKRYKKERRACLLSEYDQHIGILDHPEKLQQLQALCSELRVQTTPDSMRQCKLALAKVHVNLIDLIDSRRRTTNVPVRIFPNSRALADYTNDTKKYFPLEAAKRDSLKKILLRHIIGR
ncbi:MAG: hypothetical protein Q9195_000011 [Heterodermia aff. obscurata]